MLAVAGERRNATTDATKGCQEEIEKRKRGENEREEPTSFRPQGVWLTKTPANNCAIKRTMGERFIRSSSKPIYQITIRARQTPVTFGAPRNGDSINDASIAIPMAIPPRRGIGTA